MKENPGCLFLIVVVVIGVLAGSLVLIDALDKQVLNNQARIAEAQALMRDAEARQAQAEAQRVREEKEAELYKAAGYAIITQAELVDYYARRGDARVREGWQWFMMAVVIGVLLFLDAPGWLRWRLRRVQNAQRTAERSHVSDDRLPD